MSSNYTHRNMRILPFSLFKISENSVRFDSASGVRSLSNDLITDLFCRGLRCHFGLTLSSYLRVPLLRLILMNFKFRRCVKCQHTFLSSLNPCPRCGSSSFVPAEPIWFSSCLPWLAFFFMALGVILSLNSC